MLIRLVSAVRHKLYVLLRLQLECQEYGIIAFCSVIDSCLFVIIVT